MAEKDGEVREEKESSPAIGEMHISTEFSPEEGSGQEEGRQRTESMNSVSSESWQTSDEMMAKLRQAQQLLENGSTPLQIIQQMFPEMNVSGLIGMSERAHLAILSDLLERAPVRHKLPEYNSLADAVELFRTRKNILILTGAGVSVSCGIPDFRSKDGIYARLRSEFPDLPDPTAMFDIRYFRSNPAPFFNFAREIFPGQFVPSVSHRFIKELESSGQLLRNYTQNIDTLEHQTGIRRVVECHGSFSKCTCTKCFRQTEGDSIREEVLQQRVAYCKNCNGVIKPNIVFFGEDLGQDFHRKVSEDKNKVDLVVVIGSSLKVRPVSMIPHCVAKNVPQILINRESLPHYHADIELLGNCDDIIRDICFSLGGSFSKMVGEYDAIRPDQKVSKGKRTLITKDEFLSSYMQKKEQSEENGGEPDTKRPRLSAGCSKGDFEHIRKHAEEEEESQDSNDVIVEQPRLVSITGLLEDNRCLAISTNQTVFPGAEYSFDLETQKLVREVYHEEACDSSDSDSDSESDSHPLSRSTSENDLLHYEHRDKSHEPESLVRSDSCDSQFKYDQSETVDSTTFAQMVDHLKL